MKRIFNLFSKENSIRGASIVLIVTLALSNILGLLRDRFLTKNIETYYLDVYYAAFRIPDLIFNFLILGAIISAFIPVFSDYIAKKKQEEGYKVANILINLSVLVMSIMAIVLFFVMPYLVPLIVPKFDSERMDLTIKLSRLLMLTPIIFSLSYITGSILNCHKRFLAFSFAPIVYNFSIIIGAFLAPSLGITGVIYFVIIGAMLHFLIQIIPAFKLGYRYKFILDWKNESVQKIIKLMIPRTLSMGASQIMLVVYTAIASALAAGSIAAFNLANNIQTMPVIVLGTSFATAIFPTLSIKISENKKEDFAFYLNRSLRAIGYLLIPSTIIFFLLRAQIVRLILGSGKFSWDDTKMTAMALGLFSFSILAQGLIPLLSRAFYALKDTKTPMYISIVTAIVGIVIAYPLTKFFGVAGLALAFTIGSFVNALSLIYFLRKIYPGILDGGLKKSYLKTAFISLIMGLAVWGTMHLVAGFVPMNKFIGILIQTGVSCLVGLTVFVILSYLLEQEEMKWAFTRKITEPNVQQKI